MEYIRTTIPLSPADFADMENMRCSDGEEVFDKTVFFRALIRIAKKLDPLAIALAVKGLPIDYDWNSAVINNALTSALVFPL